jgi:serine protease Do
MISAFMFIFLLSGCNKISLVESKRKSNLENKLIFLEYELTEILKEKIPHTIENERLTSELIYWKNLYEKCEEDRQQLIDTILNVSENARSSNIYIEATFTDEGWWMLPDTIEKKQGSGFVYKRDSNYYYALTAFSIVDSSGYDKSKYIITTPNGLKVDGTIVAKGNKSTNLAIIKFPINNDNISITQISNDTKVNIDDFVLVISNTSKLKNIATNSKIDGMGKLISYVSIDVVKLNYNMDLGENTGGAILNLDGELIGVLAWKGNRNDKYGVPIDVIIQFLESNNQR